MDRKTLFLMLTEVVLIALFVVVIAVNYEPKPTVETIIAKTTKMQEEKVTEDEAVAEEKAARKGELVAEAETPEEVVKEHEGAEEPEAKAPAEKAAAPKKAAAGGGATEVADVIPMDNPIYPEHTKPVVQFTHAAHVQDYEISCGDCHHDDSGEPLTDLKMGDPVMGCAQCHSEPGRPPRDKVRDMSDAEKRAYHMEALHDNCVSCHKDYNKENNTKAAPATCGNCHAK